MRLFRTSLGLALLLLAPAPFAAAAAAAAADRPAFVSFLGAASEAARKDDLYRSGQRALDAGKWSQAADLFGQVVKRGGPEVDAALYWQAYALNKAGQRPQALAALRRLTDSFEKSAWLDDARALEIEIRGGGTAEGSEDEELKLYALNSLMNAEPERAVPMLRKFLDGRHSPKLKEQALFVLSQSDSPEARQALLAVARGTSHPELQFKAVEYLGVSGDPESRRVLRDLYAGTADRRTKAAILEALGVGGDAEALLATARQERDAGLRGKAIQSLGVIHSEEARKALRSLYDANADVQVRAAVIEALFVQNNAKTLIELYRGEKDRALRRKILEWLSHMDNPDAEAFLLKSLD